MFNVPGHITLSFQCRISVGVPRRLLFTLPLMVNAVDCTVGASLLFPSHQDRRRTLSPTRGPSSFLALSNDAQ